MKDETFAFYEDVKEKSITARSAHNKARKSGGKGHNYTESELRKMNGAEKVYQLGVPMCYADFAEMSIDLQKQYLRNIVDKWQVGPYTIARVMDCSGVLITEKLKAFAIALPKRSNKEKRIKFFEEFGHPADTLSPTPALAQLAMRQVQLNFAGAYSAEAILKSLTGLFCPGAQVNIAINIEVAD